MEIDKSAINAAGQLVLPKPTAGAGFFRTAIDLDPLGSPGTTIPLSEIPTNVWTIAQQHLFDCSSVADSRGASIPSPWEGAVISEARPVYVVGIDGGVLPAFMELKIVRPVTGGAATPVPPQQDAGFILVSLTTAEKPVVCFAQAGRTPSEDLEFVSGRRATKVLRYGPAYLAAEDASGNLIQGLGSLPLRVELGNLTAMDTSFGFATAGSDVAFNPQPDPPGLPVATPFASYAELKTWWQSNPLQIQLRKRRAGFAQLRWDLEAGRLPTVITLHLGETRALVNPAEQIVSYRVDTDAEAEGFVRVVAGNGVGGASVTGMSVGSAPIYLINDQDQVKPFVIVVEGAPALAKQRNGYPLVPLNFKLGWQPIKEWSALDYTAQPRWKQFPLSKYCAVGSGYVGCGPIAWTILLGWFEHQGVPAALGNALNVDTFLQQNNVVVNETADTLHSFCDTHCVPFTGEGATFPWDMDGGLTLVDSIKQQGFINWSASYQWETFPDCYNPSAKTGVTAIKAGRPALLGLWGMMHYAVAYGYWERFFQITPGGPSYGSMRWFRCNMGGASAEGALYPADDIFYGLNLNLTKK